jgi:hypothetical protein
MRLQRRLLVLAIALVFAFSLFAERERPRVQEREAATPEAASNEGPEFTPDETGCAGERVLDYLERHGDYGEIDPEVLLYVTREEHERLTREGRQLQADAVAGTVWTSLGPTNGAGRATALALHPTAAGTAIIGAAGGGAWRTTDNGATWTPLTETIANLSVGAVAYAPSSPTTVYLGTGEGGYGSMFIPGIGLLKSTDGGNNWTLPSSVIAPMFYRVLVHPTNPNELIIGTNAGALRSTNGQNGPWTTVIRSDSASGAIGYGDVTDIVRHPTNPLILWAATWDRNYYCLGDCGNPINFKSPTILKSTNGGQTWNPAATGLPVHTASGMVDRWSIAVSQTNPFVLYAATAITNFSTGETRSHIYKTINGGASWTETNLATNASLYIHSYLGYQAWYDNAIVVSPTSQSTVIAGGVVYVKTTDEGATWQNPPGVFATHADAHDLRYDSAGTLWVANDGGIYTSTDHGETATDRNLGLVTRQYYATTSDVVNRNRMLAGAQDNGTQSRGDAGGTSWSFFSSNDGFDCEINPAAPGMAYSTAQDGLIFRTTGNGLAGAVVGNYTPPYSNESLPFFTRLLADPVNPAVLYTGTSRLWKSTTGGEAWTPLPTSVTGVTWSNSPIRAIAIAASNPQVIMVAKTANLYRSTDGGATWVLATSGLPGKWINSIAIDPADPNRAYVALAGASGSSVYSTLNGGTNWNPSATGLPSFSAQVIVDDPTDASTLYCGTDVGVYRSTNSGASWSRFGTGMPAVSVYDLSILKDGSILRAATHGRGVWELTVTGITNHPPTVSISAPGGTATVAKGASLSFTGTATDADGGALTTKWTFPDDWSTASSASATHTFNRAGIWPVTLTATDAAGAVGGAQTVVSVTEPADSCATPEVIPAAGPFPYTVTLANDGATRQEESDPPTGGSCYPFQFQRSLWLSFTPATTGTYDISLCNSRQATWISGYTGAACGPYTQMFCHLNTQMNADCADDPIESVSLTAGVPYRFLVSNYYPSGSPSVTVTFTRNQDVSTVVASVDPHDGPPAGGTPVTITGSGFLAGAAVSFGGTPATGVTVQTPNVITAVAPAHSAGVVNVSVSNGGGTTATLGGGFTYEAPPVALAAPANVVATAASATSVNLTWNAVAGATGYEIARSSGSGAFATVGTPGTNSFPDHGAIGATAYLYKVRATAGGSVSAYSGVDLATTVAFTDSTLTAGTTPIRSAHLTEARTAVNAVRALAGLAAATFTDTAAAGTACRSVHITELRTALNAARAALGLTAVTYANSGAAGTVAHAADVAELRGGVR